MTRVSNNQSAAIAALTCVVNSITKQSRRKSKPSRSLKKPGTRSNHQPKQDSPIQRKAFSMQSRVGDQSPFQGASGTGPGKRLVLFLGVSMFAIRWEEGM